MIWLRVCFGFRDSDFGFCFSDKLVRGQQPMTSHKEETIKVRDEVRPSRAGDGPPLLFLHDTFCPSWLPIHQILAEQYEVFVPFHPGCAGSEDGLRSLKKWRTLYSLP